MAGMRVLAAVCVVLAAAPAAGEEAGAGPERFDAMADGIIAALNREAVRGGGRPRATFRPAWTGPAGVRVYCDALSTGLRNALHRRVRALREKSGVALFDIAVADVRAVTPPDVTVSWSWDGAASVRVEAHVLLEGERSEQVPTAALDAAALSGPERACLFAFRAGEGMVKAQAAGVLREEPTLDPRRIVRPFAAGEEFLVQGVLRGAVRDGAVWSVVLWFDPDTGEARNLFAAGLADGGGAPGGVAVVDPPPPPEIGFEVGDVFRDCPHCPEMVVVPAGSFMMGSPASEEGRDRYREDPQHRVTIDSPFAVGVYEVTFAEWDACVSAGGCLYRVDNGFGRDRRPIINVSWRNAQAYAEWLSRETEESYRLLSEAEWEYVARAGTVTRFHWGNAIGSNRANCHDCGSRWDASGTAPVGSFGANAFGLHDVHGNVDEWVVDCWYDNYEGAPRDGSARLDDQSGEPPSSSATGGEDRSVPLGLRDGDCSLRVLRGGSWKHTSRFLRAAHRYWARFGGGGNDSIGFRLFRSVRTFTP